MSRCRLLPICDLAKQINQGLVGPASLSCKARNDVTEMGLVERRALIDLSRKETLPQRTEWNQSDTENLRYARGEANMPRGRLLIWLSMCCLMLRGKNTNLPLILRSQLNRPCLPASCKQPARAGSVRRESARSLSGLVMEAL
jgi:hypothetical protein